MEILVNGYLTQLLVGTYGSTVDHGECVGYKRPVHVMGAGKRETGQSYGSNAPCNGVLLMSQLSSGRDTQRVIPPPNDITG